MPRKHPPFTEEEKSTILALSKEGKGSKEIAQSLPHIHVNRISGFLRAMNMGARTPNAVALVRTTRAEADRIASTAARPVLPQSPLPHAMPSPSIAPQPSAAVHSEFDFKPVSSGVVTSGGIPVSANQPQKIEVWRTVPNDGLLGTHPMSITKDDIARLYGKGTYELQVRNPNGQVLKYDFTVSEAYGPTRTPRTMSEQRAVGFRPHSDDPESAWRFRQAESFRATASPAEDLRNTVQATKELMTFAKSGEQDGAGTAKVLEKLTDAVIQPKGGDSLRDWLIADAERRDRERKEESDRRERERKEELDRRERERKDEEARWSRILDLERQRAEEARKTADEAHKRELERIKAEADASAKLEDQRRKSLMEIEDKKLELARTQLAAQQKEFDKRIAELDQQRQAIEETVSEELEKGQKHQKELFDLQKKQLDMQERFQNERLEIERRQLGATSADGMLFGTLKDLAEKGLKAFDKYAETEQLKAVVDDAQRKGLPPEAVARARAVAGNAQPQEAANGKGGGEVSLVDRFFKEPIFLEVAEEWGVAVAAKANPSTFANTFLAWMQDHESPALKKACSTFAMFMENRDWAAMKAAMARNLNEKAMAPFNEAYAGDFYEALRAIVIEAIRSEYEQFMAMRAAAAEASKQANGAQAPAAEKQEAESEATPMSVERIRK